MPESVPLTPPPGTATITICGSDYIVVFERGDDRRGRLTLTPASGSSTSYVYESECCGCNYAVFAIGDPVFCPGTEGDGGPCQNLLRLKVEWKCCPIVGWGGAGWYCVRAAGSSDPCVAVDLSEDDACDTTIEICAGPFATEGEALAECSAAATPGTACNDAAGAIAVGDLMYYAWSSGSLPTYYYCTPVTSGATYRLTGHNGFFLMDWSVTAWDSSGCTGTSTPVAGGIGGSGMPGGDFCVDFTIPAGATSLCVMFHPTITATENYYRFQVLAGACS